MSKQRFKFEEQFKLVVDLKRGLTADEENALSNYVSAVGKQERERIIKLLEEHKGTYLTEEMMYCCDGGFEHATALIKGENK